MNGRLLGMVGAAGLILGCAHSNPGVTELKGPPSIAADGPATSQTASQILLDKELVSDFRRRVDAYVKRHEKLRGQYARQNRTDVGENLIAQQALAMRIRYARHDARPGDLFTLPIARALRRAMNPELRGIAARSTRESIREDAPATFVLAVNADYPPGASRSTMPSNVLSILPPLPSDLEYRFVDTHLLLIDIDANIILDYILDVMCKAC